MKKLKLLFLAILMPCFALAWNADGHSTAGAIAYYYLLKNNPAVLKKVLATLKLHYWYKTAHWKDVLAKLPADQQDVGLFILASTYPDDAKSDKGNPDGNATHKMWHYVDFPFVVPGSGVIAQPPKNPNAQMKIADLVDSIPKERNSAMRARQLAWLFHLIEDIHQPLHCSSMFSKVHPAGDEGGNQTIITGSYKELHAYWDGLVSGSITTYATHAQSLLKMSKYQESKLTELKANKTPDDWMTKESSPDAVKYAYKNGKINGLAKTPTTITATYKAKAKSIGERRVVLAGIRLAQLLVAFYSKN